MYLITDKRAGLSPGKYAVVWLGEAKIIIEFRIPRPERSATLTTGRGLLGRIETSRWFQTEWQSDCADGVAEDPLVARHTRRSVASAACDDGEGSVACFATLIGGTNAQDRMLTVSPWELSVTCGAAIVAEG